MLNGCWLTFHVLLVFGPKNFRNGRPNNSVGGLIFYHEMTLVGWEVLTTYSKGSLLSLSPAQKTLMGAVWSGWYSPVTLLSLHIPVALLHRPLRCHGQLQGIKVENKPHLSIRCSGSLRRFLRDCDNAFIINHFPPKEWTKFSCSKSVPWFIVSNNTSRLQTS